MISVSLLDAVVVGVKRTVAEQVAAGASVAPEQLFELMVKGADRPNRLPITRLALPALLTVTLRVLLLPIATLPKAPLPLSEISGAGAVVSEPMVALIMAVPPD